MSAMQEKLQKHGRANGQKAAAGHGAFKHSAKPAKLKSVLDAYGLKDSDYTRVRGLVSKHLDKASAHGR